MSPRRPPRPDGDVPNDVAGWYNERPPAIVSAHSHQITNPTDKYLEYLCRELDLCGVSIAFDAAGNRRLTGSVGLLDKEVIAAVKKHGDKLTEYAVRVRGLIVPDRPQRLPDPKAGQVVVWVDDAGEFHVTAATDFPATGWVRWRYRNGKRWFAFSGDSWEE